VRWTRHVPILPQQHHAGAPKCHRTSNFLFSPDFNNLKLWNSGILPAPMLYLQLESVLTRTPPNPPGPSGFQSFLTIARSGVPFTSVDGRAFMTVPAQFSGYRTLPIRSRAFRQWLFDQSLSEYETTPTDRAFSAILHYLEAQAARDPGTCKIRIPYRVDSRGISSTPERILLDLANSRGQFVEIAPNGWTVTSGEGVPFETSASTQSLPDPELVGHSDPPLDPPTPAPLDTLRSTLNLGAPNSPEWLRCLAWLLAALHPGGPYPILILRGPSGCGKSLAGRILRPRAPPSGPCQLGPGLRPRQQPHPSNRRCVVPPLRRRRRRPSRAGPAGSAPDLCHRPHPAHRHRFL